MLGIPTGNVHFANAPARLLGAPEFYLQRPGFWHGGAGIAACWYGAAAAIAEHVRRSPRVANNPFAAAHLGAIDERLITLPLSYRYEDSDFLLEAWTAQPLSVAQHEGLR